MSQEHIHFVTGRLARHALEELLPKLAEQVGFAYSLDVLPITVAALMTPQWIAKHVRVPDEATMVLIPGYCEGELGKIESAVKLPVKRGPHDLRQLPSYFSHEPLPEEYGAYDIEIVAEINFCPRLALEEIRTTAAELARDGADVIDLGCETGKRWAAVGDVVKALRDDGHRVSIDSLDPHEIEPAVRSGAELVLSVNSSNREAAVDWGVEVVAIPDEPTTLAELDETIDLLARAGVPLRIDPILEPISFGFAASLGRYLEVRRRYPDAQMMMGIGNLTELTDADSAGVNALLLGFCQEVGIRSVLTTQVINWARTSVRECDLARRLMYHAIHGKVLPKHVEPRLVMLRDEQIVGSTPEEIAQLAREIRDNNYRVFAAAGEVHLVSSKLHLHDADPFVVMQQLSQAGPDGGLPKNLDPGHAFYLGFEMCKALTALTLGKTYRQDESLDWGLATRPEQRHYLKRQGLKCPGRSDTP
ncbi:MAG: dihydropteroate synthase [Planctomycetes bacterium]|nr:dihydropteroate synthase [Planctomycetota bacterium]